MLKRLRLNKNVKEESILFVCVKDPKSFLNFQSLNFKMRIFIFFFLFVFMPVSHAVKIDNLLVKGNQIIDTGLIRSHIQLKKGSVYNKKRVQQDVRKLFSLGFFDDIQVHQLARSKKGVKLLYHVKERTHITKIEFKGNQTLSKKDLQELLLIKENSFLNFDLLQKTLLSIQEKYKEKGYYLVKVSYKIEREPKEKQLKLIISIQENTKIFIKRLTFFGNRNVSANTLKAFMLSKEKNLLSFIGSSGIFKPEYIDRDQQFIEYYYRDKGYLNVRVEKPEVTMTPDKRFFYIHFSISEGPRFKIGELAFRGDKVVPEKKVISRFKLQKDKYFSINKLQEDIKLISTLYKNKGYAFVEVKPMFFPDQLVEDKIHILFKVKKGEVYRLGRIHIVGNKNARDKVILRRFQIHEGDLYSESKKELSSQLLQQLGYFEKIHLSLVKNKKDKKILDLIVDVKERENTGEAHLAGGYNSQTRLFIQGGIKKQNFLGLDQSIALNLNFNRYQEVFTFAYQSPYFLDTHWNFGADIFNVGQDVISGFDSLFSSRSQDYFSYSQLNTGFSLSLGRHISNFSTLFLKYKLQNQSLQRDSVYFLRNLPVLSPIFSFLFGQKENKEESQNFQNIAFNDIYDLEEGEGLNSSLSAILEYDRRNDRYYASRGFFARLSAEYSGLAGSFDYTKLQGVFRHYYSPFWKLVIKNRFDFGMVFSNDKNKKTPFTELFLLGGPYNLRGFQVNTQGPRKFSQLALNYALENKLESPEAFAQRPYGGSKMLFYSLELEIPLLERAELRGVLFFDIGEVNNKVLFDLDDQLRADIGFGIRWKSPFGPINLDWALPYKAKKEFGEKDWEFQFSIGSQF